MIDSQVDQTCFEQCQDSQVVWSNSFMRTIKPHTLLPDTNLSPNKIRIKLFLKWKNWKILRFNSWYATQHKHDIKMQPSFLKAS